MTDPAATPDANATVTDPALMNDMATVPVTDPAADPLAADPMYGAPVEEEDDGGFPWGLLGLLGLLGLIPRKRRDTSDR